MTKQTTRTRAKSKSKSKTKPATKARTTRKPKTQPAPEPKAKTAADVVAEIEAEKPKSNHNGSKQVLEEVEYQPAWVQCPHCNKKLVDTTNVNSRRDYQYGVIRYHRCRFCTKGFRSRYQGMV